ncbi:uncharacterized protein LOC113513625 isoform X2 [Galleria mellonella]|uniref:Uncharacterized protein LOC113513625 isoform X2 n=1 Tax=Galleria mellonella TaxID=7137 RepID=A0ABM3MCE9_GALME|nr:uncharacterized protein LOC113513625 isoform X2 [Galleria mellonella]
MYRASIIQILFLITTTICQESRLGEVINYGTGNLNLNIILLNVPGKNIECDFYEYKQMSRNITIDLKNRCIEPASQNDLSFFSKRVKGQAVQHTFLIRKTKNKRDTIKCSLTFNFGKQSGFFTVNNMFEALYNLEVYMILYDFDNNTSINCEQIIQAGKINNVYKNKLYITVKPNIKNRVTNDSINKNLTYYKLNDVYKSTCHGQIIIQVDNNNKILNVSRVDKLNPFTYTLRVQDNNTEMICLYYSIVFQNSVKLYRRNISKHIILLYDDSSEGFSMVYISVLLLGFITIALWYFYKRKNVTVNVPSQEEAVYSEPINVQYAELQLNAAKRHTPIQRENVAYSEIIGILAPR